jgi:putative membrane protein
MNARADWDERQQRDGGGEMKLFNLSKSFNWRILLVRILVNAVTLVLLALLPGIRFVDVSLLNLLLMALVLGLINAFVKPVIQFLTLSLIFVTYGFVLILINTFILLLIARLFPQFQVSNIWWALIGGALIGLVSSVLESLFGVAPPILPEKRPELSKQIRATQSSPVQQMITQRVIPQGQFATSESTGEMPAGTGQALVVENLAAGQATADTSAVPAKPATEQDGTPAGGSW